MSNKFNPYELLPGIEELPPEPRGLGEEFGIGVKRGAVSLANLAGSMAELGGLHPNLPYIHPDTDILGPLPERGVEPARLPEGDSSLGRIAQGAGGAVPMLGLLAPLGMATGGMGPMAFEQGIGLLGATAAETAREAGVGGMGQFLADLGTSVVAPGLAAKAVIPALVGGRTRWAANEGLGRLATDMSRIGTGEGTAIRGFGNYSTDTRAVAENYAKGLVPGGGAEFVSPKKMPAGTKIGDSKLREPKMLWEASIPGKEPKYFNQKYQANEWADINSGYVYGLKHDVNQEDLINLDVPWGEQSDKVKAALSNMVEGDVGLFQRGEGLGDLTGDDIYQKLLQMHAGDERATIAALSEAGIPGSRFLDAASRQQGKGSSNYVMFQDDLTYVDPSNTPAHLTEGQHLSSPWRTNENPSEIDLIRRKKASGEYLNAKEYVRLKKFEREQEFKAGYSKRVEDDPMLAIHKLNPEELMHADELGGLPAPSIAVVNPEKVGLTSHDFGTITLAGGRGLADPDAVKGHVFPSDAFSVRYPKDNILYTPSKAQRAAVEELNVANVDITELLPGYGYRTDVTISPLHGLRDNVGSRLTYAREKGLPIPKVKKGEALMDYENRLLRGDKQRKDFHEWREAFPKARGLEAEGRITPNDFFPDETIPLTLDNVVGVMDRPRADIPGSESSTGSAAKYGTPGLAAHANEAFPTFRQMDEARGRLTKVEEGHLALKSQHDDVLINMERWGFEYGDADEAIVNYMRTGDIRGPGGEELSEGLIDQIDQLVEDLGSGSRTYFESKPMRGVKLEEFGTAIVPEDTKADVLEVLGRRGLKVEKYKTKAQKSKILAKQKELFFQYLTGMVGGGAAAGATTKMIQEQRAGSDGSISGLPPLLAPF